MLNFVPVTFTDLPERCLTATSEETGTRYLLVPRGDEVDLTIDDEKPVRFVSEALAVAHCDSVEQDRFDEILAERVYALTTIGEDGGRATHRYPSKSEALEIAREIALEAYRATMVDSRARWWAARAVRGLRTSLVVEVPTVVLVLSPVSAS